MWNTIFAKFNQAHARSKYALIIAPKVTLLPLPIQRFDDPFLPLGKAIIQASRDLVGAYVFDLASYLALGGAGAVALERTIDYINDEVPTILHGAFATPQFAPLADKAAFGVDTVTIAKHDLLEAYQQSPTFGAIVMGKVDDLTIGGWWQDDTMRLVNQADGIELQVLPNDFAHGDYGYKFAEILQQRLQALV
jgi:hypothetical protein